MNKATLDKLKSNPFYKLSAKQKKEAEEIEKEPMLTFGKPPIHPQLKRKSL